jgi:hypothetical protein
MNKKENALNIAGTSIRANIIERQDKYNNIFFKDKVFIYQILITIIIMFIVIDVKYLDIKNIEYGVSIFVASDRIDIWLNI